MLGHHVTSPPKTNCKCSSKGLDRVGEPPKRMRLDDEKASYIFLENVLDMAETLSKVMIICGINECNAKFAVETVVNAFLHYDQVCNNFDHLVEKRLRKEELYHDLYKKCRMSRKEARLAYMIVNRGFKAFNNNVKEKQEHTQEASAKPSMTDECFYVHAVKKTTQEFSLTSCLTCGEQTCIESKIKKIYQQYYNRMQERMIIAVEKTSCHKCHCGKGMELCAKSASKPCKNKKIPTNPLTSKCPKSCWIKKRKPKKPKAKPLKCLDSLNPCTCRKDPMKLPWIKSIWEWPDMKSYYIETIGEDIKPIVHLEPCKEWPDPNWLDSMAGYNPSAEVACSDWFDPQYAKNFEKQADNFKQIGDTYACKEWGDPSWITSMREKMLPSKATCVDWSDPNYLKQLSEN